MSDALRAALQVAVDLNAGGLLMNFKELKAARAALAVPAPAAPSDEWQGEEWERLAWHLCAEENGEDACNELVWEGGPIPEPWGDRWMKYEPEAKRIISLARKYALPQPAPAAPSLKATLERLLDGVTDFKHTTEGMTRGGPYVLTRSLLDAADEIERLRGIVPEVLERLNELLALPAPWVCVRDNDDELVSVWRAFQMRDYARACMCPLLAEIAALREQLARFTPLRAKGVVDADDNLDCWDTNPYEICTRHVAKLNEKDPAAMWRVVDLFARDEG